MECRRYLPVDFKQIKAWGKQHETVYREEQFPKIGFIVDGVAAYFLYQTDSKCCWLENMIANREVDKKTRDQALEMIIIAILEEAERLGFTVAYASTSNVSIVKRALEYGAMVKPLQFFLTKILGPSK